MRLVVKPRPGHFTPGKDPVLIVQKASWVRRDGLDGYGKSRPHRNSTPDRLAGSESLYRLNYPGRLKYSNIFNKMLLVHCSKSWYLEQRTEVYSVDCR